MSGWYVDKFAPSLPMSTYLVAMIVSDMTYEEAVYINNEAEDTTIRVYLLNIKLQAIQFWTSKINVII